MANYRRTATGNWSTLAQWQDDSSGSYVNSTVLPGATDVVYANNFTVTLDIDVVVSELRTTTALNVNAGGLFDFGAALSVTADIYSGTTNCLRNNTGNAKILIGNLFGGLGNDTSAVLNQSGQLTITGNITGGNGIRSIGLTNNSVAIVTGNILSGTGGSSDGIKNSGILTITGSSTGQTGNNNVGVNSTGGIVNHIGTATGGGSSSCHGVSVGGGTYTLTTAIGSSVVSNSFGLSQFGGTAIVNNIQFGITGFTPVSGAIRFSNTAPKTVQVTLENNTTVTLVDNSVPNYPLEADVEQGVSYGPANIYTGTLVASISPQDIFTAIANSSDPIAVRLRNVSTVATTAATVASFDV